MGRLGQPEEVQRDLASGLRAATLQPRTNAKILHDFPF
jgi:hypothetical protein